MGADDRGQWAIRQLAFTASGAFRVRAASLLAALLAIATVTACVQPVTPPQNIGKIKALGKLELSFEVSADGQRVTVRPQAVLADNAISGLTRVIAQASDDGTTRYINASFEFTNLSGAAFNNLTLYAYNQAANNAGGTALKNLVNFGGSSVAISAQQLRPTHPMTVSAGAAQIISGREDLQVFSTSEAASAETAATPSILGAADAVLEYGFSARGIDASNVPTGTRTIPVGAKGRVAAGFKLPSGSVTGTAYSFVATFLLADELNTRITRSPEETTAQTAVRASAGNEVVLVGSDSDTVTTPSVTNIRLANARISTTPALLLEPSCDPAATPLTTTIPQLQGTGAIAALTGTQTVDGVIVADFQATGTLPTERNLNGFYIQDRYGDGNAASSDAVFVFEGSAGLPVNRSVGDFVRVTGTVAEFNGGTQLTGLTPTIAPTIIACGTREQPAPVAVTLPQTDLERFEGMRVTVAQTLTVTETFTLGRYGMLSLSSDGRLFQPTNIATPGANANAQQALNDARRILLDDGVSLQNPNPIPFLDNNGTTTNPNDDFRRIGDTVTGFTGVLAQSCASASCGGGVDIINYRLLPTQSIPWTNANPRSVTPASVSSSGTPSPLRVVSTNVLNYFNTLNAGGATFTPSGGGCTNSQAPRGANSAAEFTRQRSKIIAGLVALDADVLGLVEMQNNGSGSSSAVQDLVNGLNTALGAGTYAIVDDSGISVGCDAIKVAMIYKPARVSLTGPAVSDANAVFSRPAVAQTFRANSGTFTLVMNHFKSKGSCPTGSGPDSDIGDGQSCWNELRKSQATQLKAFIETLKARTSPVDTDILTMGDFNAYLNEDPMTVLEGSANPLNNLIRSNIAAGQRYSYVFDGQSGNLDYALASTSLAAQVSGITEVHYNSDEPINFDYNLEFKQNPDCVSGTPPGSSCFGQDVFDATTPFRYSDHDPILVGLGLTADSTTVPTGPVTPTVNLSLSRNASSEATPNNAVTITATASSAVSGAQTVGVTVTGAGITATDYSLSSPTITIADGQTTGTATLTVLDDTDLEGLETATITLVSPSSGIALGGTIAGNVAITDNEVAPVAAVVISQVYGGGGNAGAPFRSDFVELKNNSSSTVSLATWSVQYTSSAGTTWALTALSGSIAPGGYYLVQQAAGAGTTLPALPTPDATGTLAMSGTAGKVALVNNTTALTGSSSVGASIVDFVGYGTAANGFEGAGPTPTLSNTTAAIRNGGGCADTNVNSSDFATGAPAPRNSSSTAVTCP